MRYATLHITSDASNQLPAFMSIVEGSAQWQFSDDFVSRRERRNKIHAALGSKPPVVPRYHWSTTSEGFVDDVDPWLHVQFLLDLLDDKARVRELKKLNFDFWIAFCWTGNGTGGGPQIAPEFARFLADTDTRLDIGFYLED